MQVQPQSSSLWLRLLASRPGSHLSPPSTMYYFVFVDGMLYPPFTTGEPTSIPPIASLLADHRTPPRRPSPTVAAAAPPLPTRPPPASSPDLLRPCTPSPSPWKERPARWIPLPRAPRPSSQPGAPSPVAGHKQTLSLPDGNVGSARFGSARLGSGGCRRFFGPASFPVGVGPELHLRNGLRPAGSFVVSAWCGAAAVHGHDQSIGIPTQHKSGLRSVRSRYRTGREGGSLSLQGGRRTRKSFPSSWARYK